VAERAAHGGAEPHPASVPPVGVPPWWPHVQRSAVIEAAGLRWHVQRWGGALRGRPVALLIHGTGAGSHSWRHLAPLLAKHFDVIAPDLPGHAFTHTPDTQPLSLPAVADAVAALLGRLQVQPALVVGHSAGAAVALRMALSARIAPRLVVSINGAVLPLQGALGRMFMPAARLLAASPLVAPAFAAWAALPSVARRLLDSTGSRIDAEGERCYAHLVADGRHAAGTLRLMASWDLDALAQDLPRLDLPLLLMAAEGDRTLAPSHALRVQAVLPQARVAWQPGLGHLSHEEDAAATLALIDVAWAAAVPQPEAVLSG
jgi:magnesium chelatase accessory protein